MRQWRPVFTFRAEEKGADGGAHQAGKDERVPGKTGLLKKPASNTRSFDNQP